ncbi:Inner membrane protein YrbG [Leucoagaricus sp. SymC.cos]|nr:Inner membrane protein YrbG [Leucoagaricus sp. SymC.cos]
MVDGNVIAYNIAAFISTLFLLEFGADKFVDHTAIVARRTGIPDTIIALLTAGAEWEELVVVVASLAQGRPSLAIGNIVGSAISNILGAFSLGLLGKLTAPEDSDSDSSDDKSDAASTRSPVAREEQAIQGSDVDLDHRGDRAESNAHTLRRAGNRRRRSLGYHIGYLFLGFLAICLSGYVLSRAAINFADAVGISDVLFGVIILAIATTLPEKFVAVLSGNKGHIGILVANTVGSNVFLLFLCLGIIMVDTSGKFNGGNVRIPELVVLWCSTLALTLTVWVGGRFDRWIGGAMLLAYVIFIVLEFTVIHNVTAAS